MTWVKWQNTCIVVMFHGGKSQVIWWKDWSFEWCESCCEKIFKENINLGFKEQRWKAASKTMKCTKLHWSVRQVRNAVLGCDVFSALLLSYPHQALTKCFMQWWRRTLHCCCVKIPSQSRRCTKCLTIIIGN